MEVNMKELDVKLKVEKTLRDKGRYENYKQFLASHKKIAKGEVQVVNDRIKRRRKRLKQLIERHEAEINRDKSLLKGYKTRISEVDTEYSYRKKISHLVKKYDFIDVEWEGDYDVYTTWVWHKNDEADKELFDEEHFHDSYEAAYNACLECIEWANKNSNIKQAI